MNYSKLNYLTIWTVLLSCSIAGAGVYLPSAPLFAEAGQRVNVLAAADLPPAAMILQYAGSQADGQIEMTQNGFGYWQATIETVQAGELTYQVTAEYDTTPAVTSEMFTLYVCDQYTPIKPGTLKLKRKVVSEKKWNGGRDAFGLTQPSQGPPVGPAAIAYRNRQIHLLDSAKGRVLTYNKSGKLQRTMDVPTRQATDLSVSPDDDSVVVVSQLEDKVFHYRNGTLNKTESAKMKGKLPYPSAFDYDWQSERLQARSRNRQKLVTPANQPASAAEAVAETPEVLTQVKGNALLVKTGNDPQIYAITFKRPVGYIDETVVDENGAIWILYSMKGDYRIRRLVRFDTASATAQTAQINVWFSFDATRYMTAAESGVILMCGDMKHGRIVTFDYIGGAK